jgi:PHD/YefM family antitoxin component YafN of YafNO toxin-antitoxin module
MQVTNYSSFRKHLKTYIDDCVENNNPIIINRDEQGSMVLIPLENYKDLDETGFFENTKKICLRSFKNF